MIDPRFRYFSLPMKGDIAPDIESDIPENFLEILDTVAEAYDKDILGCRIG